MGLKAYQIVSRQIFFYLNKAEIKKRINFITIDFYKIPFCWYCFAEPTEDEMGNYPAEVDVGNN